MINSCPKTIGIDISSSSVKAVCLDKNGILESYGVVDLPVSANDTDIILALKSLIGEKCVECLANVGLRGLDVLTKTLEVTIGSSKEVEMQVEEQVNDFLPVSRDEVVVSWEVIGKEKSKVKLIVIIIPKKVIDRYNRLVEGSGLSINNYEINAFSLKRALTNEIGDKTVMIVDMHSDETDIEIFDGESLILDKTVPIGGKRITKELSRSRMISIEEAEKQKRMNQDLDEQMVFEIYKPLRDDIVSEIAKIISMIAIEYGLEIDQLILAGGDFNSEQWKELVLEDLRDLTEIEIKVPEAITKSNVVFAETGERMRLSNAVGLALRK